jgi:hypothetical protein
MLPTVKGFIIIDKRVCITGESVWFSEIGNILSEEFKPKGYKIPTK